ncbi:MAG TPA: hypothetical protein VHE35_11780, partial [Kofleriaceae bacterium]|nr:hypothetical protein [Kofleriaceae bacterium]
TASPIAPGAAEASASALAALAATEAPGAHASGGPFGARFDEGEVLEQPINLEPGACYTVVGVATGITQLDLQITAQPAPMFPPAVVAQSATQGPDAVLGGKAAGCWKMPAPVGGPGKVVLRATHGSGTAAAQVYVQ